MSKLKRAVCAKPVSVEKRKSSRNSKPKAPSAPADVDNNPPSRSRRRRRGDPKPAPTATAEVKESAEVKSTREQIKGLITMVCKGRPQVSIDLTLAILVQETGNHKAANLLIDELKLDETFGLKKF